MRIPNPLCWLRTAYRSLIWPGTLWFPGIHASFDGCDYIEVEQHDGVFVRILRCESCGKYDFEWSHSPFVSPRPNKCECHNSGRRSAFFAKAEAS